MWWREVQAKFRRHSLHRKVLGRCSSPDATARFGGGDPRRRLADRTGRTTASRKAFSTTTTSMIARSSLPYALLNWCLLGRLPSG
jgi:hypothetical protein